MLKICEIYASIQGESSFTGYPCVFIRVSGCNLRCVYCDTRYAYEEGDEMPLDDILHRVESHEIKLVEITGGEPLLQKGTPKLAEALLAAGYGVLVETNGSLDISVLPEGAVRIMDIKCPSSGESGSVRWENLWRLRPEDEVKFVITDRHDYEWARGIVRERFGRGGASILFSPVFGELPPGVLVEWMLEDKLQIRFQLQIHKYIWPHGARGV